MTVRMCRGPRKSDDGITMVLVVGITATMALLTAVLVGITLSSLRSASSHGQFERALSVAEAGIDRQLARVQQANDAAPSTGDAPVPAPDHPDCPGSLVSAGASFPSQEAERSWARGQLELLALRTECRVQSGGGEVVVLKPADRQAVYALSAVPSFAADDATTRLLKAEYLFSPYQPSNAVFTASDLCFRGRVDITSAEPELSANVHTNGDVTCDTGGGAGSAVYVEGAVSASGEIHPMGITASGGLFPKATRQSSPSVDPRTLYRSLATAPEFTDKWFDLCPDGKVRKPSGDVPCSGVVAPGFTDGALYYGWKFEVLDGVPTWSMPTKTSIYAGVYYVFQGDAVVGQGGGASAPKESAWNATVIAESSPTGGDTSMCAKLGGNITYKLVDIENLLPGLIFYAHGDIVGDANATLENGLIVAGDQVRMTTLSSELTGAVLAADQCDVGESNLVQGQIHFDGLLEAPLASMIRTALWLEYVG